MQMSQDAYSSGISRYYLSTWEFRSAFTLDTTYQLFSRLITR